jgi:hypothetical protein
MREANGTYRGSAARNRWVLIVDNAEQGLHGLQLVIGRLAFNQLNDGAAQTPDVRRRGGTRQLDDLWRHPVGGADDAGLVQARLFGGDAKVGQLDESFLCCEDVGTLDVSMNNTLLVEVEQAVQDLGHVQGNEVFGKLAEVFADAVQRAVFAVPVGVSGCRIAGWN